MTYETVAWIIGGSVAIVVFFGWLSSRNKKPYPKSHFEVNEKEDN